jgi:hypothetical protein
MNPETQYPEIKEMKTDEIFIEWVYIVKDPNEITEIVGGQEVTYTPGGTGYKIHIKTIIKKQSYRAFVKALEQKYNVGQEAIELVTISR